MTTNGTWGLLYIRDTQASTLGTQKRCYNTNGSTKYQAREAKDTPRELESRIGFTMSFICVPCSVRVAEDSFVDIAFVVSSEALRSSAGGRHLGVVVFV